MMMIMMVMMMRKGVEAEMLTMRISLMMTERPKRTTRSRRRTKRMTKKRTKRGRGVV